MVYIVVINMIINGQNIRNLVGELIDKITILEIKKDKISNKEKLLEVDKELNSLKQTMNKFVQIKKKFLSLKIIEN